MRWLIVNGLWYLACLPGAIAFRRALRDVPGTQERLLLRLLTREPVQLLEPTSGSTAATKHIPYTASLKAGFQRAVAPWIADLYGHHPALFLGQSYWSVSPVTRRNVYTAGGIPIGFEDDAEYLSPIQRSLVRSIAAVPPLVRLIDDVESFCYVNLLFLLRSRALAIISVWSSTFLTLLLERLPKWWPQLAADVAAGTLSPPHPLAPDLHARLSGLLRPDPSRATEIRAAFEAGGDLAAIHARLWPHLRIISRQPTILLRAPLTPFAPHCHPERSPCHPERSEGSQGRGWDPSLSLRMTRAALRMTRGALRGSA
ncbi:MAG: GH3 auxin-responsive promoter family protein [Chloroflexi bacterium]|nr:GH3 auxin-responsive promoter family protein [Chloroflexota bacterium]